MEFSIRDEHSKPAAPSARTILGNESGQGLVEYILIMVVTVAVILGGIYQLNSAFKSWANNYFGTYLACLLETGELPSISGGGGDAGVCNEAFKPFTLSEGRPLVANWKGGGEGSQDNGTGSREKAAAGSRVYAGGGYGGGSGSFSGGGRVNGFGRSRPITKKGAASASTGNTGTSNYGGYSSSRPQSFEVRAKPKLDTQALLRDEAENTAKRKTASSAKNPRDNEGQRKRIQVNRKDLSKKFEAPEDTGLTLPNFLRFLIIAAIVIAMVLFLGGQALQIGKSMND